MSATLLRGFGDYLELSGSGLLHAGARLYDPALARFISPDPRRQLDSPYSFTGGDPLHRIDPDGRAWLDALRVGVGVGIAIYAGLGAAIGAGIGAGIGRVRRGRVGGMNATQLGAVIGASVGGALGALRFLVEVIAIPVARRLQPTNRQVHPIILYNRDQWFMPSGAQMIAEAEGIPRDHWTNHIISFEDFDGIMKPGVAKPDKFDGRLIVVAHGEEALDQRLMTGTAYDGMTGSLFIDTVGSVAERWATNINRIDFCVCLPGEPDFAKSVWKQLGKRQSSPLLNQGNVDGWIAAAYTTPFGMFDNWGRIRAMNDFGEYGTEAFEILYNIFPFRTPGVHMPASITDAEIGPWRKLSSTR
jgi:RHS repeat-associated protein